MAIRNKRVTYYVIQAFTQEGDGQSADQPVGPMPSEDGARRAFERLKERKMGAVLFSRTGDAGVGEFDDAVVLAIHGVVPFDVEGLLGA